MSHFARVMGNVVTKVIVAEQDFINSLNESGWVQCSYNTFGGVHLYGGTPLRKNYPGIGYTYDKQRDAFIPPKQYASWALNEQSCLWEPPIPYPTDGNRYVWDETIINWKLV